MQANQPYTQLLQDLKSRISQSRYIAARLVNQEQLKLYLSVGALIDRKMQEEQWGTNVISQIALDLKKELPELRGFSDRNLRKMRQFYQAYYVEEIWQLLTAKLQVVDNVADVIWPLSTAKLKSTENTINETVLTHSDDWVLSSFMGITFTHHVLLLNKCELYEERLFYMHRAATEYWTVEILEHYIKEDLFGQNGRLNHNFDTTIRSDIGSNAGDTGQLHFYLNVLDDKIRLKDELPSIGIILCKEKQDGIVHYSIRNMNSPMGVATFMNTSEPPAEIQQVLPDSDQLRKLI